MPISTTILENGVVKTWDSDASILTFTIPNSNRATVDTYIEAVLESVKNWDTSNPYYGIQDITSPDVSLTPYLRGRLPEITQLFMDKEINSYIVLVMDNSFTAGVMKAFGRLMSRNTPFVTINFVTDISKAHEWIAKQHTPIS